jgi:hypothetical protein
MITKLPQSEQDQMYLGCTHIEYILVHGSKRWNLMRPQPISPTNQSCATSKGASSCAGATRAALAERGRREPCRGRRGHESCHGRARGREEVGRAGRASLGTPRAGTRRAAEPIRASALPGAGRVRAAAGNESAQGGAAPRWAGRHGRAHGTAGRLGRAPGPRRASAPDRGRGCVGIGVGEEGGARPPWPRAEATPRRAPGQR